VISIISQTIVLAFGIILITLAAWGIFAPGQLMKMVTSVMDRDWGIYVAVIVRLVLGAALIIVAPASSFPVVFQVLGWVFIIAAVVIALAGRERLRRFIAWWSERFSMTAIRVWLLFGMAFGVFIVDAVL